MTPDLQKEFDAQAYQVGEAIYEGCGGLTTEEINTIADSIFTSTADCTKYGGMFVDAVNKGIAAKEDPAGGWDGIYSYAQMCNA